MEGTQEHRASAAPPGGTVFVVSRPGPYRVATVAAPWGPVRIGTTADAVVGIAVLASEASFQADIERRTRRHRAPGSSHVLDRAVEAIERFLDGDATDIRRLPLDLADRGSWDRAVLDEVRRVGPGEVTSYGRVAAAIGRRGAARAVGGAVGRNPISLAIPCHRVVAGDGTVGGYGGDWFGSREQLLDLKRVLLEAEGVTLPVRWLHLRPSA